MHTRSPAIPDTGFFRVMVQEPFKITPVWSGGLHTEARPENIVMGNIGVMTAEQSGSVTGMLEAAGQGDKTAIGQLYGMLYPELRSLAHQRVRSLNNVQMLDTTSLVHESYLRLVKAGRVNVENRKHFLAYAAHVMRSVVVDFVRHSRTERAGGAQLHVTLNSEVLEGVASPADEILRMHEFLEELAQVDSRLVSVIEMRYFAALDNDQIAEVLGVTDRTVRRDLEKARLLLLDALL